MDEWLEPFDDLTTAVEEEIEVGDRVIVRHRMQGRGRDSGVEVDLVFWQLVSVSRRTALQVHAYNSREETVAAAQSG